MVHQRTHYTQYFNYNIPSDWVIHHPSSRYMYCDGCHKSMSYFAYVCCYSYINPQVIFYDVHDRHFENRSLDILRKHNIHSVILKAGDSVHYHPNNKNPNMKLNNLYANAIMNWKIHHKTLKFTPAHMNSTLVSTWEDFKLSSAKITQNAFKKKNILPLLPPYIDTNHQDCLACNQQSNR